ncbi:hypothetical protein KR084_009369 [Drosophila pseudotakahashii]|nr:hypothetical protein KR084_009369 [Drosophila pseudotakahashii]
MVHHDENPGMTLLGPRTFPQEVDIQLLEWLFRLDSFSNTDLHPEIWRLRLLADITSTYKLADLENHAWPVELPSEDFQSLSYSAMSCYWVCMRTLDYTVGQTLWDPQFTLGTFHLIVQIRWRNSLEDETILDLQRTRWFRSPKTPSYSPLAPPHTAKGCLPRHSRFLSCARC